MKKVLFFTRLYRPHIGGVEKHVEQISQILQKQYHVSIVTEQYDRKLKESETSKNLSIYRRVKRERLPKYKSRDSRVKPLKVKANPIQIYRIPVWQSDEKNKKWFIWKWLWQYRQLIKEADIIHIHDVFFWFLPFRFIFPAKKVFITFHGYKGSKTPRLSAVIQRKIAEGLSQRSICVGEFMTKWYYASPDLITYGAADNLPTALPKKLSAVFIGRLDYDIGIMEYLEAIKLLKTSLPLTVYGDGPLRQIAEKFAQQNKLPVTFKGTAIKAAKKLKNFRFAFVSRYLSILEAMQTKRLVLAHYNNQIKKDYLTCHPQANNMIIFKQADDLVKQLNGMLKNPQQEKQMIDKSYAWANQQTWEKLAKQYINLWEKVTYN